MDGVRISYPETMSFKDALRNFVSTLDDEDVTLLVRVISERRLNCISNAIHEEIAVNETNIEMSSTPTGPYDIHDAWQDK